jgi:hypothetical protein
MGNKFNTSGLSASDYDGLRELNNRLCTIGKFIYGFMQSNDKSLTGR